MQTRSQTKSIKELGPNGGPVRITRSGDKVERVPGEGWDLVLRRGVKQIIVAENEFREKTWWLQWSTQLDRIAGGEFLNPALTPPQRARANATAKRIQLKYGGVVDLEDQYLDFRQGMIVGKLSALRWVLGYDWNFYDTMNSVCADKYPHRSDDEIFAVLGELFDKVWWNRYQIRQEKIEAGERPPNTSSCELEEATRIEAKYGVVNLGWDDFDWGRLNGKFSALRWVTGSDWDFLGL